MILTDDSDQYYQTLNRELEGRKTRFQNCNKFCILLSLIVILLLLILIVLVIFLAFMTGYGSTSLGNNTHSIHIANLTF